MNIIKDNLNYIDKNINRPKKIYKKIFKRTRKLSRLIPDNKIDSSKLYSFNSYKYKLSNDKDIVLTPTVFLKNLKYSSSSKVPEV